MKTAVSLPNLLYERVEETALNMGIPPAQLFILALEDFIEKHNAKVITDKINAVYEKIDQNEFDQK